MGTLRQRDLAVWGNVSENNQGRSKVPQETKYVESENQLSVTRPRVCYLITQMPKMYAGHFCLFCYLTAH